MIGRCEAVELLQNIVLYGMDSSHHNGPQLSLDGEWQSYHLARRVAAPE